VWCERTEDTFLLNSVVKRVRGCDLMDILIGVGAI
jgi:hypothetical protein